MAFSADRPCHRASPEQEACAVRLGGLWPGLWGPAAGPPCRPGCLEAMRVREQGRERRAEMPSFQHPSTWRRDQWGPPNRRGKDTAVSYAGVCCRARPASWAFKGQKFNSNSESEPTNEHGSSPGVESSSVGRTRAWPRPGAERCGQDRCLHPVLAVHATTGRRRAPPT